MKKQVTGFSIAALFIMLVNATLTIGTVVGIIYGIAWVAKHFGII